MKEKVSYKNSALIKEFLSQKNTAPTTKKIARYIIAKLIRFLRTRYHERDFTKITPNKAEHFIGFVVCGGAKPAYVNHIKYASEAFYDFLVKKGVITVNPFSSFIVSVRMVEKKIYVRKLLKHYDRYHPRA